ncbi:MAG: hypothetical protein KAQ69_02900 [Spirochaetales bacterium]|nr:hypothetical protein [Spirochaetales bacterium]
MKEQPNSEEVDISKDILIAVYEAQWADIQHSRNQDWELSKTIMIGFLGLSGISALKGSPMLIFWLSLGFIILSITGLLVTIRHNHLFKEKMDAINLLEKRMGIDKLYLFKPRKALLRWFKVQTVLILMYIFSALLFLIFIISILQNGTLLAAN